MPFLSTELLEGVKTDADSKSFAEELSGTLIGLEKLSSELVGLLSSDISKSAVVHRYIVILL